MLKPKITIGCQTTEATLLEQFCEKWRLGAFVLQRRCQDYKSEFECCCWDTLFFFLWRSFYVCYRYDITSNDWLLSSRLILPVLTMLCLTTSWMHLFINVVIFLEDMKATLHRLLLSLRIVHKKLFLLKTVLVFMETGGTGGYKSRKYKSRGHSLIWVLLHSMNFPLTFCHQWVHQPWKVIINRLWQP